MKHKASFDSSTEFSSLLSRQAGSNLFLSGFSLWEHVTQENSIPFGSQVAKGHLTRQTRYNRHPQSCPKKATVKQALRRTPRRTPQDLQAKQKKLGRPTTCHTVGILSCHCRELHARDALSKEDAIRSPEAAKITKKHLHRPKHEQNNLDWTSAKL